MDGPMAAQVADHGGGIDAARARFGGAREEWIDLSTGINPIHYPLPDLPMSAWTDLPDQGAQDALIAAARRFWRIPPEAAVLAAPGTSALIARIPALLPPGRVHIPGPTYNEHARAFTANGWALSDMAQAQAFVAVIPNNPDGRLPSSIPARPLTVIDESFSDTFTDNMPEASVVRFKPHAGTLVLKGLGKFWGLAGLRLGFAIGDPSLVERLAQMLGPWPVSGPALAVGTAALSDDAWANATRLRLSKDASRLDAMLVGTGAKSVGGTSLFRLYDTADAIRWQEALARQHIWTRAFPYSATWLRFGLPGSEDQWQRLAAALETLR